MASPKQLHTKPITEPIISSLHSNLFTHNRIYFILFYFTKSRQTGAIFVDPSTVQLYLDESPPVELNFILKLLLGLEHESAIKKLNNRQSKVLKLPTASRSKVNQSLLLNRKKLSSFSPGFYSLSSLDFESLVQALSGVYVLCECNERRDKVLREKKCTRLQKIQSEHSSRFFIVELVA